jgi:hypothetical protein
MKNRISSYLFIIFNLFPVFLVSLEIVHTVDIVFIYILENVVITLFRSGLKFYTVKYTDINSDSTISDIAMTTIGSLIFCAAHAIFIIVIFQDFISTPLSIKTNISYILLIFLSLIFLHGLYLFEEYKEELTLKVNIDTFTIFSSRIWLIHVFILSIPFSTAFLGVSFTEIGSALFFIICKLILELHLISKEREEEYMIRITMPFQEIAPEIIKALQAEFEVPQFTLSRKHYRYHSFTEMKNSREFRIKMMSERMADSVRAKEVHSYIMHQASQELG